MTEIVINQDKRVKNGDSIVELDSQLLSNSESPMGSFLSIESEQSSEEEEKVHDTTMANRVKILNLRILWQMKTIGNLKLYMTPYSWRVKWVI